MSIPSVSIIDDDRSVRESTSDLLNSAGFATETFTGADEFLTSGRIGGASCIVADVRMPGMSGLDLHNRLQRAGNNIPIILITAFPKEGDRKCAMDFGVHGYLPKPFNGDDLLSSVRSALSDRRGQGHKEFGGALSLFHEPWWLSAATNGGYEEVMVKQGADISTSPM